jgi:hypothetical protein
MAGVERLCKVWSPVQGSPPCVNTQPYGSVLRHAQQWWPAGWMVVLLAGIPAQQSRTRLDLSMRNKMRLKLTVEQHWMLVHGVAASTCCFRGSCCCCSPAACCGHLLLLSYFFCAQRTICGPKLCLPCAPAPGYLPPPSSLLSPAPNRNSRRS